MSQALDLLRHEHSNLETLLRILEQQVNKFQRDDQPDYDVMRGILDYLLSFPNVCHHPKEDLIFARLRDRDPLTAERIGDVRSAHEELAARAYDFSTGIKAVLEEAEIPREIFIRLAHRFIDQQRQHINMEESTFFPAAEKALMMVDWIDLKTPLRKLNEAGERFEQLRERISEWQLEDEAAAVQDQDPNRHRIRK